MRELIDAFEDLATAKQSVQMFTDVQEEALKRFLRSTKDLKERFKERKMQGVQRQIRDSDRVNQTLADKEPSLLVK
jgi:hypothetical protein